MMNMKAECVKNSAGRGGGGERREAEGGLRNFISFDEREFLTSHTGAPLTHINFIIARRCHVPPPRSSAKYEKMPSTFRRTSRSAENFFSPLPRAVF